MSTLRRLTFLLLALAAVLGSPSPALATTAPFDINFAALPITLGPGEVELELAFVTRNLTNCTMCPINPPPNVTCCTGLITVSVDNVPPGVDGCVFDGGLCLPSLVTENPSLLLQAGNNLVPGVYHVTLRATAQDGPAPRAQSDSLEVTVVPFSLVVSHNAELLAGRTKSLPMSLARNQGYDEIVQLSAETNSPLLSADVVVDANTGEPTSLVLSAAQTLANGTYTVTLTATDGVTTRTTQIFVEVRSAFQLSVSPGARDTVAGVPASFQISVVRDPDFSSRLAFSFTTGNPGITGSFAVINGQQTLTLAVQASVAPGNYPIQITATGGGISKSATAVLKVHRFLLQLGESFALLEPGGASFTIPITLVRGTGFTSTVSFSISSLPIGSSVGATFSPSSTTTSTSSLRLSAGRFAPEGDYTATITANAGLITETAAIGIEVVPNGLP